LNGQELEPGLALSVLISDPEKKKQRSDANSDQREVYITGLSRFVAEKDLRRLFGDVSHNDRIHGDASTE
jgi:RNA recognition motif-containing protein